MDTESLQILEDVVVGSGPTAWACLQGIWDRGGTPTVIDIGYKSHQSDGESTAVGSLISLKRHFGSDHMYRYPLNAQRIDSLLPVTPISGALGGFSTVWGAGIQPVSDFDLRWYPGEVRKTWLSSSRVLLERMNVLGAEDCLSHRDPWPSQPIESVKLSPRFERIFNRSQCSTRFHRHGVVFGSPRLAISGRGMQYENPCKLCGQCMTGCPENSIFDSGRRIETDLAQRGGRYISGYVDSLVPISQGSDSLVEIRIHDNNGSKSTVMARRVYLAAGPVGTTVLLQRSELLPKIIRIRDSQMFYAGFLCVDSFQTSEVSMTTSQGYFSTDRTIPEHEEFSCSVYESSSDFEARLFELLPRVFQKGARIARPFVRRVIPGIGFIAPEVSSVLVSRCISGSTVLTSEANPNTPKHVRLARKRMGALSRKLGLQLLPNPFPMPPPGSGFHTGSSVPMGSLDSNFVDWLGSLKCLPAIRIVDASSLPRIRAGSHTFMAMANAYRISASD